MHKGRARETIRFLHILDCPSQNRFWDPPLHTASRKVYYQLLITTGTLFLSIVWINPQFIIKVKRRYHRPRTRTTSMRKIRHCWPYRTPLLSRKLANTFQRIKISLKYRMTATTIDFWHKKHVYTDATHEYTRPLTVIKILKNDAHKNVPDRRDPELKKTGSTRKRPRNSFFVSPDQRKPFFLGYVVNGNFL